MEVLFYRFINLDYWGKGGSGERARVPNTLTPGEEIVNVG